MSGMSGKILLLSKVYMMADGDGAGINLRGGGTEETDELPPQAFPIISII